MNSNRIAILLFVAILFFSGCISIQTTNLPTLEGKSQSGLFNQEQPGKEKSDDVLGRDLYFVNRYPNSVRTYFAAKPDTYGGELRIVINYETKDSFNKVNSYYLEKMPKRGWNLKDISYTISKNKSKKIAYQASQTFMRKASGNVNEIKVWERKITLQLEIKEKEDGKTGIEFIATTKGRTFKDKDKKEEIVGEDPWFVPRCENIKRTYYWEALEGKEGSEGSLLKYLKIYNYYEVPGDLKEALMYYKDKLKVDKWTQTDIFSPGTDEERVDFKKDLQLQNVKELQAVLVSLEIRTDWRTKKKELSFDILIGPKKK